MCVILSIYQQGKDEKIAQSIAKALLRFKTSNKNGIGTVAFSRNNQNFFWKREMDISKDGFQNVITNNEIAHFHLRQATSGVTDKSNIHFWKKDNWYFAHNGVIFGDSWKSKKDCDSLMFFKKMYQTGCFTNNERINYEKVKKLMKQGFIGRFIIVNSKTRNVYYFGDWYSYLINGTSMVICSTSIHFNSMRKFFGVEFDSPSMNVVENELDGIYVVNTNDKTCKRISSTSDYSLSKYYKTNYPDEDKPKQPSFTWTPTGDAMRTRSTEEIETRYVPWDAI